MRDANEVVGVVFSGLSPLVVEDVVDEGERSLVRARTRRRRAACPGCGIESGRVHGYHERTVAGLLVYDSDPTRDVSIPVLPCLAGLRGRDIRPRTVPWG